MENDQREREIEYRISSSASKPNKYFGFEFLIHFVSKVSHKMLLLEYKFHYIFHLEKVAKLHLYQMLTGTLSIFVNPFNKIWLKKML